MKRKLHMKRFKKTYIEITNKCNLSCEFCPKTVRKTEFMGRELFEEILIKLQGHSEFLYFHVMGEPLLHPEIGWFLDVCARYNYRVNITTNGTLISKTEEAILSKPALRQVNFSLHSFDANAAEGSMDSYLDGIFRFIHRARDTRKLLICLRLWNISENGADNGNGHILRRMEEEFGLGFTIEEKITPCKGIKLGENIFLNQAEKFDWPDIEAEDIGVRGFCYGLRDQVAILVDGTVVPCCLDGEGAVPLGNIQESSMEAIVNSERARNVYEGFSRREAAEALCRKCGYRGRFSKK